jgi:hypothetical protein
MPQSGGGGVTGALVTELEIITKRTSDHQVILPYRSAVQSYEITRPMQLLHRLFIEILMWTRGTAQHTLKKRGCGHRENEDACKLTRYLLPDASIRQVIATSAVWLPQSRLCV